MGMPEIEELIRKFANNGNRATEGDDNTGGRSPESWSELAEKEEIDFDLDPENWVPGFEPTTDSLRTDSLQGAEQFRNKYIGEKDEGGTVSFEHDAWLRCAEMLEALVPEVDSAIKELSSVQIIVGALPAATRLEDTVHGSGGSGVGGSTGDSGKDGGGQKALHLDFLNGMKRGLTDLVEGMRTANKEIENGRENSAQPAANAVTLFGEFGQNLLSGTETSTT
jgi:hypothetical protein